MKTLNALTQVTVSVAVFAGVALAAPPEYTVEVLGPGTVINDMNASGEIVGWTSASGVQAFIAGPDHPHEILPLPAGYSSAWAQGINDEGVVVGSAGAGTLPEFGQAVMWTPDGNGGYEIAFLGQLPQHTQSVAYDINNRGDIIGSSIVPGFQGGPTVWFNSPDGVLDISSMGAPGSPKEINDQGVVVGINGGLFDIDTMAPIALPPFSGNMSGFQGWAINEHNELAGTAFFGGVVTRAAANWTIDHGWQFLNGFYDASAQIYAFDINDDALTVMQAPQPAAYFDGFGTFSLSSLLVDEEQGKWLFFANQGAAVNNAGQIANIVTHQPTGQSGVGIMTPVTTDVEGDLDGDGNVNISDLLILLAAWGPCEGVPCPADIDGSGAVNVSDLLMLLANWN